MSIIYTGWMKYLYLFWLVKIQEQHKKIITAICTCATSNPKIKAQEVSTKVLAVYLQITPRKNYPEKNRVWSSGKDNSTSAKKNERTELLFKVKQTTAMVNWTLEQRKVFIYPTASAKLRFPHIIVCHSFPYTFTAFQHFWSGNFSKPL